MEGTTSYILDASVIVKLLNQENESHTKEALDIIERAARGIIAVSTSELAVYEVFNALIKGKGLTGRPLQKATEAFYLLPLSFLPTIRTVAVSAAIIAEKQKITFYDATYLALAFTQNATLITANPKHQKSLPSTSVLPLDKWQLLAI